MANDPTIFVQIVSTVYRPHGDDSETEEENGASPEATPDEDNAARERRATNAYHLLSSWGHVPGLDSDGRIDAAQLRQWVDEANRLLREARRLRAGQDHLGKVLVSAPADPDGTWPPEVVRDLLEDLQNEVTVDGFYVEVLNRRGMTSRGPEDGGAQELDS
jgi:hypothetical protein